MSRSSGDLQRAVKKACSIDETAPKRKHVRACIVYTWDNKSSKELFSELQNSSNTGDEVQLFKMLILLHKSVQEGHGSALIEAIRSRGWIRSLGRIHDSSSPYGKLISRYVRFLIMKLDFHAHHKGFRSGTFEYKEYVSLISVSDLDRGYETILELLALQDSVDEFSQYIFASIDRNGNSECKIAALVPLISESYGIHKFVTSMIRGIYTQLDDDGVLHMLIEKFGEQHLNLFEFYADCASIKSLSSLVTIPKLPRDPPSLAPRLDAVDPANANLAPRERSPVKAPSREPTRETSREPTRNTTPQVSRRPTISSAANPLDFTPAANAPDFSAPLTRPRSVTAPTSAPGVMSMAPTGTFNIAPVAAPVVAPVTAPLVPMSTAAAFPQAAMVTGGAMLHPALTGGAANIFGNLTSPSSAPNLFTPGNMNNAPAMTPSLSTNPAHNAYMNASLTGGANTMMNPVLTGGANNMMNPNITGNAANSAYMNATFTGGAGGNFMNTMATGGAAPSMATTFMTSNTTGGPVTTFMNASTTGGNFNQQVNAALTGGMNPTLTGGMNQAMTGGMNPALTGGMNPAMTGGFKNPLQQNMTGGVQGNFSTTSLPTFQSQIPPAGTIMQQVQEDKKLLEQYDREVQKNEQIISDLRQQLAQRDNDLKTVQDKCDSVSKLYSQLRQEHLRLLPMAQSSPEQILDLLMNTSIKNLQTRPTLETASKLATELATQMNNYILSKNGYDNLLNLISSFTNTIAAITPTLQSQDAAQRCTYEAQVYLNKLTTASLSALSTEAKTDAVINANIEMQKTLQQL